MPTLERDNINGARAAHRREKEKTLKRIQTKLTEQGIKSEIVLHRVCFTRNKIEYRVSTFLELEKAFDDLRRAELLASTPPIRARV